MPELPEVETIVRQLDRVLPRKVVERVEVLREKSAQSDLREVVGRKVKRVRRIAKNIIVDFDGSDRVLMVHLKMTGQLIFVPQATSNKEQARVVGGHPSRDWVGELPSKHTRIVVRFTDGSKLFFNDMRVFGWWKLVTRDKLQAIRKKQPPDVVDPEFGVKYLRKVLRRSRRAVKLVILDQTKVGGMGNIYACDALWLAGVDPRKPANKLKAQEVARLQAAMVAVIEKGIETGGASYSDYVDTGGLGGKYQEHFLVYAREGEKCRRVGCGGVIEKVKLGGRGTYFCRACQV